jgi:squalene cyclase
MNPSVSPERLQRVLRTVTDQLLSEIASAGHWVGELSSSALSTATAVIALSQLAPEERLPGDGLAVERALDWLRVHQNSDGGWGDTICSRSNISTTALVWAAFGSAKADDAALSTVELCVRWLQTTIGQSGADWVSHLAEAIRRRFAPFGGVDDLEVHPPVPVGEPTRFDL